ncbi:unnamed protein product [Boreogadus saida]
MNIKISVGCTLAFTLVDLIVSTVLYCHGSHLGIFSEDLLDFNVLLSLVDLWGCVLIRACLLLGASAGVLWNRELGPRRVCQLHTLVLLVSLALGTFALVKLLILSEREGGLTPWFLGLFSWTCVSSLGMVLLWGLLGKETVPGGGGGDGGGGDEDRERLVDDREKKEEEEEEEEEGEEGLGRRTGAKAGPQKTGSGATLGRLLWYCREDVGLLSAAFLFLLISAVCEAFLPYYTGKAIDGIVTQQSMEDFTQPLLKLSALAVASALAIGVRAGVFSLTLARLNLRLRNKLFRSLMRQEIGFFDGNHTGDITSRLTSDTTQVSDLVSINVNVFLRSAVKAVGFFVFMFGLSWRLTLVTLMGFPFIAVVSKVYGDYYKRLTKEVQTSLAAANKVAEEVISSMRTVRSFACEEREADSYYSRLLVMYRLNRQQALAFACFMWSSCFSELALEVAILYYGGHLVVSGQMTGGTLIAFVIYALELVECLEVSPVCSSRCHLSVPPGNTCLFLQVSLVGQEPVLFARTVEENISYGLTDVSMETVVEAASQANAHDFISALTRGYHTGVGEKGTQLSGGQKQRVAIARALVRQPRVLILDEATSALDAESEHIVQQALGAVMRGRTVLVVAHRLSTVERAHNILVLEAGAVAEQGSHAQLMARGGLYCRLVQRQLRGLEAGEAE